MNSGSPAALSPSVRVSASHRYNANVAAGGAPSSVVRGLCHHLVPVKSHVSAELSWEISLQRLLEDPSFPAELEYFGEARIEAAILRSFHSVSNSTEVNE